MITNDRSHSETGDEVINCERCIRTFSSKRGLCFNQRKCTEKTIAQSAETDDGQNVEHNGKNNARMENTFKWGDIDGDLFVRNVTDIYEITVYWRRNLCLLPTGKASRNI